jgi:hypothetical protein
MLAANCYEHLAVKLEKCWANESDTFTGAYSSFEFSFTSELRIKEEYASVKVSEMRIQTLFFCNPRNLDLGPPLSE